LAQGDPSVKAEANVLVLGHLCFYEKRLSNDEGYISSLGIIAQVRNALLNMLRYHVIYPFSRRLYQASLDFCIRLVLMHNDYSSTLAQQCLYTVPATIDNGGSLDYILNGKNYIHLHPIVFSLSQGVLVYPPNL
jgi:hypothetical protein